LPKKALVATAYQHGAGGSGGIQNKKLSSPKEKRRKADKKSARNGKVTLAGQAACKNFRRPAMLKTTPLDCEKKQSMSEEARPVASGERAAKSGGCLGARRLRRDRKSQACLDLVRRPVAQPPVEAS
jgi:hypothetical protein